MACTMDGPPLLKIVAGTTFGFDLHWTTGDKDNPYVKLSGCTAVFVIRSITGDVLVRGTTESGHISIIECEQQSDKLDIQITHDQTQGQQPQAWENANYEVRVTFPSGDLYSILRGPALLIKGAVDD
ncbi:TPA: hypothetical protein ACX6QF_000059 [Photobacterium damselae]